MGKCIDKPANCQYNGSKWFIVKYANIILYNGLPAVADGGGTRCKRQQKGQTIMITKYRFGIPILNTEAVIVPQPEAAVYQPGDAVLIPGMTAAIVDAADLTDGSESRFGPTAKGPSKDVWQFTIDLKDGDIVYGLGEAQRGINKRGWLYISNNVDDMMHTESKYNLYASHNFLVVDRADGQGNIALFLDDPGICRFDVGYTDKNKLVITASSVNFDLYTLTGEDGSGRPMAVTREFRHIIGRSYIPPKWGMGYGQSRYQYYTDADIRQIARDYHENGIPLDMIYLDIDYMKGYKDFTVDTEALPDLTQLSADLKEDGVRMIPIIDAGIAVLEGDEMAEEGMKNGYFCTKEDGTPFTGAVWPGNSYFTDYLNPEARRWFGMHYKFLTDQGIEGFWNDMNEPSIFFTNDTLRRSVGMAMDIGLKESYEIEDWQKMMGAAYSMGAADQYYDMFYHNVGGRKVLHRDVHNLYGYNMTRAAGEAFDELRPGKRTLMFSRSSYIGMHRYGGVWTGDNASWWAHLQQVVKQQVGLNMAGFMFNGSDTGGFSGNTTEDLMTRWLEFSMFTPLFRNHACIGTRHQELYYFKDLKTLGNVVSLRYAFLPYLYSEFVKAALANDMYMKPLSFVYENDPMVKGIEDQLMVGESIMIAPVVTQNAPGRNVYLPEEMRMLRFRSADDYDSEVMEKGWHYIPCGLGEVLVFLRKGHLFPTAAPALTVSALDEQNLRVYAFGDGSYTLYQDDGVSKDYENPENLKAVTVKGDSAEATGLTLTLR